MLMVDFHNYAARITLKEIVASGRRYVTNPIAFASFMSGVSLHPGLLLDKRWGMRGDASNRFAFFHTVMHEILPPVYDARHLEELGGRFCFRLTGVRDYTVIAFNRRVVTLSGLPVDAATGARIIDAEMRADVFRALCNEMIATLSLNTLAAIEGGAAPVPAAPDNR